MPRWPLRLRALLDGNYAVVVGALVVLALLGGWLTYGAYVSPGTHAEERPVSSWRTTGQFDHGATVTEENSVFSVGARLSNRTTYFRSVAPVLDGTFRSRYDGAARGNLSARVTVTLVLRSVGDGESGEPRTEYWRDERELASERVESVSPRESVSVPFEVDVNELQNRTSRIRTELGSGPGEVEATVRANVRYTGMVEGRQVNRTVEHAMALGVDGGVYRVDDPGPMDQRHEETRTVTVRDDPGAFAGVGGPLLFVVATGATAAVVVARRRDRLGLAADERAWLDFRADRSDFEEWIVTVRLPEQARDLPRAEAETLADLVDFAIDTDNAVVEHPDTGEFAVVHGVYRYVYDPPARPTRDEDAGDETGDGGTSDVGLGEAGDSGEPDEDRETVTSDENREDDEPVQTTD
ncbi:DUF5305 domain-containing protein [Halorussus salinisoli]|uniref:DUF5305 domain-containing protein n=1 Tax=Halorussus salinisoli TaxID=2558242 RepID=UPI0010C23BB0|nr:DUF5305 domain-containing protein [Halorussus salinisoli]